MDSKVLDKISTCGWQITGLTSHPARRVSILVKKEILSSATEKVPFNDRLEGFLVNFAVTDLSAKFVKFNLHEIDWGWKAVWLTPMTRLQHDISRSELIKDVLFLISCQAQHHNESDNLGNILICKVEIYWQGRPKTNNFPPPTLRLRYIYKTKSAPTTAFEKKDRRTRTCVRGLQKI